MLLFFIRCPLFAVYACAVTLFLLAAITLPLFAAIVYDFDDASMPLSRRFFAAITLLR